MTLNTAEIDRILDAAVLGKVVPGLVATVVDPDGLSYAKAFGWQNVATRELMEVDSIQRIASMTKLPTAITVLQLIERGELQLSTPVGNVLPQYDELQVLEGFDDAEPIFRPPARRGTVLDLLTHTSGLAYAMWNAKLTRYLEVRDVPPLGSGLRAAFEMPLVSDPGAAFNYGMSMDWAALVVEAVTRQRFEAVLEERVFQPLGLHDTVVKRSPEQVARSGSVHVRGADGQWVPIPADYYMPGVDSPEFYAGGHSLYASAIDYARFQSLLLNGGEYQGQRLLNAETVESMFANHIGELEVGVIETADPPASFDVALPGRKWGLGIMIDAAGRSGGRSAGSGGWAGGFNTFFWVDREQQLSAALYTQTLPFYEPGIIQVYEDFEAAVYSA